MSDAPEQLIALDRAFVAAALSGGQWGAPLRMLADMTGSARGQLIGIGGARFIPFNYVTDVPQRALDEFVEIGGGAPEISFRVAASIQAGGRVAAEADYDAVRPALASQVYLDFCEQWEMPFGIQGNLSTDEDGLVGLAVLRSHKDGRSSAEQRRMFEFALPVVANAVKIRMTLEQEGVALLAGMLEAVAAAAIILDGNGIIRGVTPRADRILTNSDWLEARRDRLGARHPADREAFAQALAKLLRTPGGGTAVRTLVLGAAGGVKEPVAVDLIALPRQEWSLSYQPRVIVLLRLPAANGSASTLLQSAFNLTRSEAEVAELLAQGLSRNDIAERRGASVGTVSVQLKNIFQKFGVTREALLIVKVRSFIERL